MSDAVALLSAVPQIPDLVVHGRRVPADWVDAIARRWHAAILGSMDAGTALVAAALPSTDEGFALFIAATALPVPVVLLEPDPGAWHSDPPMPAGTLVALPPSLAALAAVAGERGYVPIVLDGDRSRRATRSLALLSTPQIITFTSGSTGAPRPVCRRVSSVIGYATTRLAVLGVGPGEGVVAGTSLAHGNGLTRFMSAMMLGGPFAWLDPRDHRAALSTLARPEYQFWGATAHFVDVLSRCVLTAPPVAPRVCLITNPMSERVFRAFGERFGVPLRQNYSSSETGALTVDAGPAGDVRRETVGRPLPGVEIRIGDHPDAAHPAGVTGRIWARTPWLMDGYGFPPALDRPGMMDAWWPTRDLGSMTADGWLRLEGRIDDCIRTREGQLVNLAAVAEGLRRLAGVQAVEVVPMATASGASFGAVLECRPDVTAERLRQRVAGTLPDWSRPRRLLVVPSLPRRPNGKVDRRACVAALDGDGAS